MPTALTIFGLRVVIYPNDHRPAHVHIIGNGCEAVFNLHCPKGPARGARKLRILAQSSDEDRRRVGR